MFGCEPARAGEVFAVWEFPFGVQMNRDYWFWIFCQAELRMDLSRRFFSQKTSKYSKKGFKNNELAKSVFFLGSTLTGILILNKMKSE